MNRSAPIPPAGANFYAYVYCDPRDGTPFYVGKGRDYRANVHLRCSGPNKILKNKITQLKSLGLRPAINLFRCPDEDTAFALEMAFIAEIGRRDQGKGPLLNYTDGGEGSSGRHWFRHSEETKARIAAKLKGRLITQEHRDRISAATKGRPSATPETQAKALAARQTPEARAKFSAAAKRSVSKEHLAEMTRRAAQVNRGIKRSEETKRRNSEVMKGRIFSPETLKRMSEGQKRRYGH